MPGFLAVHMTVWWCWVIKKDLPSWSWCHSHHLSTTYIYTPCMHASMQVASMMDECLITIRGMTWIWLRGEKNLHGNAAVLWIHGPSIMETKDHPHIVVDNLGRSRSYKASHGHRCLDGWARACMCGQRGNIHGGIWRHMTFGYSWGSELEEEWNAHVVKTRHLCKNQYLTYVYENIIYV